MLKEIDRKHGVLELETLLGINESSETSLLLNGINKSILLPFNVLKWEAEHLKVMASNSFPIMKTTPYRMTLLNNKNKQLNDIKKQINFKWSYWITTRPFYCILLENILHSTLTTAQYKTILNKTFGKTCLLKFVEYLNSLKFVTIALVNQTVKEQPTKPTKRPVNLYDFHGYLEPDNHPAKKQKRIATTNLDLLCNAIQIIDNAK